MAIEDDDWTTEPAPERSGILRSLVVLVPLISIAFLALLTAIVIWIARNDAQDRTRSTLLSDSVWVEQALRFQLSSQEDMLQRAAFESARPNADLAAIVARVQLFVASNPELLQVVWYDAGGRAFRAVPDLLDGQAPALPMSDVATVTSRPRYGAPRRDPVAGLVVDMAAPLADGSGQVVARLSVADLVSRHVPWWITERYAVQIVDAKGTVLAEKARVEPRDPALAQQLQLDPPLPGLALRMSPYHKVFEPSSILLPAAIIVAAVLAGISLIVLQRQSTKASRAEARLAAAVAFRHAMEDSLTVGLRAKDQEGRILYVNAAFCKIVGHAKADLVGMTPPMPFWTEDIHSQTVQRSQESPSGLPEPQLFETRFRRPDGSEVLVQVHEAPLLDGLGRHRGWMGSFIDATEQTRAQDMARLHAQTLQRTGRLVTMGEMASTLAHELNQPLSAIASYSAGLLNVLRAGKTSPELLRPPVEKLALQAERAGLIIRRVQDFTRKQDARFRPVALERVIAESCDLLAPDARQHGIHLVHGAAPGLHAISADPILLEQVLTNLIRNGIEAMAARPARQSADLIVALTAKDGFQVIEVIDNGIGIDPAIADRLFELFSSTKPDGMGIGLNICRSIVELHHGQLHYRANPQGGTIFSVRLPDTPAEGE